MRTVDTQTDDRSKHIEIEYRMRFRLRSRIHAQWTDSAFQKLHAVALINEDPKVEICAH